MRPSVIQVNPAHRAGQNLIEEEPVENVKLNDAAEIESAESDSSELIIVDDSDSNVKPQAENVLNSLPFRPKENQGVIEDIDSDSECPSQSLPSVIRPMPGLPVRPIPSVIKPIPSMIRKIDSANDPPFEKKMKSEAFLPIHRNPINVAPNVLKAVVEVQRKAEESARPIAMEFSSQTSKGIEVTSKFIGHISKRGLVGRLKSLS